MVKTASFCASAACFLTALALAACGASGRAADADETPSPDGSREAGPGSPPGSSPDGPVADAGTGDGGADASSSRARCGQAPYDWVTTPALGDVLEQHAKASHTPLELNYVIYEARRQGFKTRRIAQHSTKSKLIRYQTQDRGKLLDATAQVAMPDVSGARTFPVLLVLHGTAGFTDRCSPSGGVVDDALDGFKNETAVLLSLFASFGYIVVAPDYIGLKSLGAPTGFLHPYLVGEPTAIASIDALRATKKLMIGSNLTPGDVVVVGGSQGGHAAAFVNRYLPHYAPELAIKGSVWDVPPTDLLGQARPALTSFSNPTKNLVALTTTYDAWYQAAPGLASAFKPPFLTSIPAALATGCSGSDAISGASLDALFQPGFLAAGVQPDFGSMAPWSCYLNENSLPTTSVPKKDAIPSMFLLGEADELVNVPVERASFQTLCAQGHTLTFLECAGASHTKPLSYALDQWLDFLEARLAGAPLTDVCVLKPAEVCTSAP